MAINKEIIIRSGIFRPIKFTNTSELKRRSDLGEDLYNIEMEMERKGAGINSIINIKIFLGLSEELIGKLADANDKNCKPILLRAYYVPIFKSLYSDNELKEFKKNNPQYNYYLIGANEVKLKNEFKTKLKLSIKGLIEKGVPISNFYRIVVFLIHKGVLIGSYDSGELNLTSSMMEDSEDNKTHDKENLYRVEINELRLESKIIGPKDQVIPYLIMSIINTDESINLFCKFYSTIWGIRKDKGKDKSKGKDKDMDKGDEDGGLSQEPEAVIYKLEISETGLKNTYMVPLPFRLSDIGLDDQTLKESSVIQVPMVCEVFKSKNHDRMDNSNEDMELIKKIKFLIKLNSKIESVYIDFTGFKRDKLKTSSYEYVFNIIKNNSPSILKGHTDLYYLSDLEEPIKFYDRKFKINGNDHFDLAEQQFISLNIAHSNLWVLSRNSLKGKLGSFNLFSISEQPIKVELQEPKPVLIRLRTNFPEFNISRGTFMPGELFVKIDLPEQPKNMKIDVIEVYENIERRIIKSFKIKDAKYGIAFNFHWTLPQRAGFYYLDVDLWVNSRKLNRDAVQIANIESVRYFAGYSDES